LAKAIPDCVTAAHNGANTAISLVGIHPKTNQVYTYLETLGGGFGDPKERQGKFIKYDLKEGNISKKTAKEIYGINID